MTGTQPEDLTEAQLVELRAQLQPLVGTQFTSLVLPALALGAFEPSQIGTIAGALMDALIPHREDLREVGLEKHEGILGDREGYPDYRHASGLRAELKLLYVDNPALEMKRPSTPREPSARLTQKVTVKNVNAATDVMLLIAYQLQPGGSPDGVTPTIVDLEVFRMIELVTARDERLIQEGGMWFGNYETPCVLSIFGRRKRARGLPLDTTVYGRKASEGRDFNEDTNFGKLNRIPHPGLQAFIAKHLQREPEPRT